MKYFLKLKKKHNLFLIEDCAHAFLGKYDNNHLGTIGDFGAFSFHETKNFVGGQCGALSINNFKFVNRAKILLDKGTDRSFVGDKKKYYSWKGVGSEFRSAELPAALLYSQLLKSKKIQIMREKIWNYYYDNLRNKNNNKYYVLSKNIKNKSGFHVFAIIFKGLSLREKFINFMKKKGIYCFFHYYPLHLSTFGKKFSSHRLLNTEKVYNGLVRLPLYPSLKKKELKKIMKETSNFLK